MSALKKLQEIAGVAKPRTAEEAQQVEAEQRKTAKDEVSEVVDDVKTTAAKAKEKVTSMKDAKAAKKAAKAKKDEENDLQLWDCVNGSSGYADLEEDTSEDISEEVDDDLEDVTDVTSDEDTVDPEFDEKFTEILSKLNTPNDTSTTASTKEDTGMDTQTMAAGMKSFDFYQGIHSDIYNFDLTGGSSLSPNLKDWILQATRKNPELAKSIILEAIPKVVKAEPELAEKIAKTANKVAAEIAEENIKYTMVFIDKMEGKTFTDLEEAKKYAQPYHTKLGLDFWGIFNYDFREIGADGKIGKKVSDEVVKKYAENFPGNKQALRKKLHLDAVEKLQAAARATKAKTDVDDDTDAADDAPKAKKAPTKSSAKKKDAKKEG